MLIVFEGLDCSGKTTQAKRLAQSCQGIYIPFPYRKTVIGSIIDAFLRGIISIDDWILHYLFSLNRLECMPWIQSKLDQSIPVIIDRYIYSGLAYSVAKGLPWHECQATDHYCIRPDMVFFLHIRPNEALFRKGYGSEQYENQEFQTKVYDIFIRLANHTWHILNGNESIPIIEQQVWDAFSHEKK